jgi:hypothetical protein
LILTALLATTLPGSLAIAHRHHEAVAQAARPLDSQSRSASPSPSVAPATQAELQQAFFDYELLLHLALQAPTSIQPELIALAEREDALVRDLPNKLPMEQVVTERQRIHQQLRSQFEVVSIDWTERGARWSGKSPKLTLTAGLDRHVLLEVHNQLSRSVDLIGCQRGDADSPRVKYTILPDAKQLIPVRLRAAELSTTEVEIQLIDVADEQESILQALASVQPAALLRGTLMEGDKVCPGRVYVVGSDHQYRHGEAYAKNETLSQKQLLQFWNAGRYYQLPFFYSDGEFVVRVPAGRTKLRLERGFEHELVESEVFLQPGEERTVTLTSNRFVDMAQRGWISGDTHVHWVTNQWNVDLPLKLLSIIQRAEDLRVANNLTLLQRGPSLAFINPQQAPMGPVKEFSDNQYHVEMGEEYRNEDLYGHLCFLNLDWLVQPIGTGSIIAGPDSLDYPLNKTAILACREQGGISCEAHGLGGNKDVPVNVVHNLTDSLDQIEPQDYYDFLDCGFHLPLTNGSDHPARVVGCARAYVKVDGDFSYEKWIEGIRKCRTFTTSGPLLTLSVNEAAIGETLDVRPGEKLRVRVEAKSRQPLGRVQIVCNGEIIKEQLVDDRELVLECEFIAHEPSWVVARCSTGDSFNAITGPNIAHTSAVYIDVEGESRLVAEKANLWIQRMQQHVRDIRAKGRFANRQQLAEAVDYVQAGISRFQEMLAGSGELQSEVKKFAPSAPALPQVESVESQALLAQVDRLVEALNYIGCPLSAEELAQLEELKSNPDEVEVTRRIQELLDPHALAAVEIAAGRLHVTPQPQQQELFEQGWRLFLVKVCNLVGTTSRLQVESLNALPRPHSLQRDVSSRWMGLSMFDSRPLQPNLSGLELEYRVVELSCSDAAEHTGVLEFSVDPEPGRRGRQIREWRFDRGADGWNAENHSKIEASGGAMRVVGLGGDPFITAPVGPASGELVVRFVAETSGDGVGQLFWWTEGKPMPDAERCVTFPLVPGGKQLYELRLNVAGPLAGLRIDPCDDGGEMTFDWIDLSHAHRQGETWDSAAFKFRSLPATPVTLKIHDPSGAPGAAALIIRDKLGRVYPPQSKRLAPDLFFHSQIYRLHGETVKLPPGEYDIRMWRGPHSLPETRELTVATEPRTLEYSVQRWIDPTQRGWWSGDHHIHAAGCLHYQEPTQGIGPEDMLRQLMGEDLNVGCCLTWGPCFDYQKRFFSAKVDQVSKYPYLLRYDVEISGFGSHASGHLNLLRLKEQIYPGGESKDHWPTLGLNALRWAKQQDAICGTAHSGNGLTRYVDRLPFESGPKGLPHFNIPAFDGIGACEYVVDITHEVPSSIGVNVPAIDFIATMNTPRQDEWNMWYHTLNCGYRVRASGETDFPCMSGERVGIGRVYVNAGDKLTYENWVQGIQDGRSYVSDATTHLLDFEAQQADGAWVGVGHEGRSELKLDNAAPIKFRTQAAAFAPDLKEVEVELIVNGYPVESQTIVADGDLHPLEFTATIERSSWVALRVYPHAHTNPFFVIVDEQPIRASRASAEWFLRCVEQCWQEKAQTYAGRELPQAQQAYDHAREAFQRILAECGEEKNAQTAP